MHSRIFQVSMEPIEEERQEILRQMNYNESTAFEPYKRAFKKRMKSI